MLHPPGQKEDIFYVPTGQCLPKRSDKQSLSRSKHLKRPNLELSHKHHVQEGQLHPWLYKKKPENVP